MAVGFVVLIGLVHKYPRLNPFGTSEKPSRIEKITETKSDKKGGTSLLGFVPEPSKEARESLGTADAAKSEAFLRRFANVAVSERKKFGIPASVILAVAYANSQAGEHKAATAANNFFALPCGDAWEGETMKINGDCLRKYESAWASFRDFSIYLSSQEWFGSLKKSAGKDPKKWIEKIAAEGIANGKDMRTVFEAYKLEELQ